MAREWLKRTVLGVLGALLLMVCAAGGAQAQLMAMGPPLNTTLVLQKPAPGQVFGNQKVIKIGVGSKIFKFYLKDAYVDDPSGRFFWSDVWQQVRQYNPNLVIQGQNSDTFEKMQPGQTLTIKGMYAPLTHTYEVVYVMPGKPFKQPKHF